MTNHSYRIGLGWDGSTGAGLQAYSRDHAAVAPPAKAGLTLSADPAFRGNPELLNPEQLVVMAASSCQLLSFLAVAARAGVDVLSYDDQAEGFLDLDSDPARLGPITLRATITVAAGTDESTVRDLADQAHRECYVANSLAVSVHVATTVVVA